MIYENIVEFIENRRLDEINSDFNTIKAAVKDIWTGSAASSFDLSFSDNIRIIDKIYESIDVFNNILDNLSVYKENYQNIKELERQIAQELENPSLKTTETYVENGVTKTAIKYVVDQELINRLQNQINLLTEENLHIKKYITTAADQIVSLNLKPKNNSDISHRGYRTGGMRDNSIESYEQAGQKGFWGLEADVLFDSKGKLVCSHNPPKAGENPPSFEEYLDICKKYGMTAIIDLKYERYGSVDTNLSPTIIKTIEEKGMIDSCIIQTNNHNDIPFIRQTSKEARIWYLTDVISDKNIQLIQENNVEGVNMQACNSDANKIKKLNDIGVDVCIWNVQTETSKARWLGYGAKHVMSDNVLGITPYQEGEKDYNGIEKENQ